MLGRRLSKAGSVGGEPCGRGTRSGCEGLAVLVVEEVRVDRSVEARIVQLDREVVAAFAGALRPGGADLGSADIERRWLGALSVPVASGTSADVIGLEGERDDFALTKPFSVFVKVPMFAMIVLLALVSEPRPSRSRWRSDRPETIDAASACGPKRSGGCQAGDFLASRGMAAQPPGRKSNRRHCGLGRSRRSAVFGQIRPSMRPNELRAPGTENPRRNHGDRHRPRPQTRQRANRSLSSSHATTPAAPGTARQNAPDRRFWRAKPSARQAPNRTASRARSVRLTMRACERPLALRSKLGKQRARPHQRQIVSRGKRATTAPVCRGPPKQRSGMRQPVSMPLR